MTRWQADLALGMIALIWGSTFVMVQNALDDVGPLTFVAWRFILATAFLAALAGRRLRTLTRAEGIAGALAGLWLGGGYIFQTVGLQTTTTAKTGFITGLSVVIVPLLATALLRRPPGRGPVFGIVIATTGLALLTLNRDLRIQTGDGWVLAGAFMFALQIVTIAHYSAQTNALRLAVVQLGAVAVLATGGAFAAETPSLDLPRATWGAIAFTGLVATALVFSVQTHVQRFTTPTHTALLFGLEPVFAALFGWWLAGEVLGPRQIIGCALILAGMLVAELVRAPAPDSASNPARRARSSAA